MHIFAFLVFSLTFATTIATTTRHRRTLHQPFFPDDNPTPPPVSQPPVAQPPATILPPSINNIPFISTSPPNDNQPFFPSVPPPPPSPPPPATTSTASFPANISALNLPTSPKPKHTSSKLIPIAITLAILAVIILFIISFLKLKKRKNLHKDFINEKPQQPNTNNSINNDFFASTLNNNHNYNKIPKLTRPSQTSSEFLYLGTLVNSHSGVDTTMQSGNQNNSTITKVGSPELRPLPPLTSQKGQTLLQHDGFENSECEGFYSPGGSGGGATAATATVGRRSVGSGSTTSFSSSSSGSPTRSISLSISPPVSLSPRNTRMKSPEMFSVQTAPPPSRPAPPPPPPLPDVGLSKDSLESSPRLSNSSNDQKYSPARIPPPPIPPVNVPEISPPVPVSRLNPPVLVKPTRSVRVSSTNKPVVSGIEMLPEKQETFEANEETRKPKLKALHWDKVRANSDHEMVWDHLKSNSFKLNEEMIETLFIVKQPNANNSNEKSAARCPILPSPISNVSQVLDPKKSQNIAIALRAFSVTTEEVCDALLEGDVGALGTELLESLLKMAPTKEDERKLKEYRVDSPFKLGPAEKFLKAVLGVPFAFKRVGAMLYVSNFGSEVEYLKRSFQTLEAACEELRNNRMFLKLLEAVLKTGNRMNVGTNRGDAQAFKLDTLLKLIDIKGADGKTTLLHFVVQEIIRLEGARLSSPTTTNQTTKPAAGLQIVSSLSSDLLNVKKSAAMDSEVLNGDVTRLSNGIANIINIIKLMESTKFSDSMNKFLKIAQQEVIKIQVQERETVSLVKEVTEYFHGNSAKEEAHPLRIFVVVKDFLTVLDRVCKEVGTLNDRINHDSVHKVPVNSTPVYDGFHKRQQYSSSDDESSSSSL